MCDNIDEFGFPIGPTTIFYDEFGYKLYVVKILRTNYSLNHLNYLPNRRYYSINQQTGFKSIKLANKSLFNSIKNKYEYKYDCNGNQIYSKNLETGAWYKKSYDNFGNWVRFERSDGRYWSIEYRNGLLVSYEDSDGNWWDINHLNYNFLNFEPIRIGNGQQLYFPELYEIENLQLKLDLDFT